ncbi:chemotaxis protein CheE [Brevundimonas goettingensis]|uniref:Chemotaxis protein CheE n=1 Tax=Brevundimonas goettingensis TaxID=2774190 RepID=A0A975GZ76_9CAUL|nr:chemotaxis protein CheE [Brevundimonas goettingensis]QTC92365.1 chemotaxis protein CheE [Brevundimonas goettingensis]
MVVVLRKERKSRLSAMIDQAGGISVGVALAQARAHLETLQAQSQAIVGERVAELAALKPPAPDAPDARQVLEHVYDLASAVIDAAGPFELIDLCAVAAGLCDLIDAAAEDRPFDWRIVTVHAQSMQLILSLPPEAVAERAQVLDSLKQVMAKKIPAAPGEANEIDPA